MILKTRPIIPILVSVGVSIALAGLLLLTRARKAQCERQTRSHSIAIVLSAIRDFDRDFGIPAAVFRDGLGRPLSSWRFNLLWRLPPSGVLADFNAPWCDAANSATARLGAPFYCFSASPESVAGLETNLFAVTGPGTAFDETRLVRLDDLDSDTILLVEVGHSGVHWMEPGDLNIRSIPPSLSVGFDGKGLHIGFADGQVWYLDRRVPAEEMKKFFTVEGAKRYDRERVLRRYCVD